MSEFRKTERLNKLFTTQKPLWLGMEMNNS